MQPLRLVSILAWVGLLLSQVSLLWPSNSLPYYWGLVATLPLLAPAYGLICDHLYTYRWVGFLILFYFCVGISEWVANPALQSYALATTIFSTLLFLSSMYHSRYLGIHSKKG